MEGSKWLEAVGSLGLWVGTAKKWRVGLHIPELMSIKLQEDGFFFE